MSDALDLSKITLLNSPDIHAWPVTTSITKLELTPGGVRVSFTKKQGPDRWPDVPFGKPGDSIQFTLWIVLQVASSWWAAGCIEFYSGLEFNGGPPQEYAQNWYYDPIRWTPMTGHQPVPGETVGFLVTSGDARHGSEGVGLQERSNLVAVPFPNADGGTYEFTSWVPAPAPGPLEPPPPSPELPPAPIPRAIDDRLDVLDTQVAQLEGEVGNLRGQIDHGRAALVAIADALHAIAERLDALGVS